MITIISGTNRRGSMTSKVAKHTFDIAKSLGIEANLIDLSDIPTDFILAEPYTPDSIPSWLTKLQSEVLIPAKSFIFVSPEYNGSIPGFLKLFIDVLSVHKLKESFNGKHAIQIGVAAGRAGNLRGIDHFAGVLNHIGCINVPGSLPISGIKGIINQSGEMKSETKDLIQNLVKKLDSY